MTVTYAYLLNLSKSEVGVTFTANEIPLVTFHGDVAVSILNELEQALDNHGAPGQRWVVQKYIGKIQDYGVDV